MNKGIEIIVQEEIEKISYVIADHASRIIYSDGGGWVGPCADEAAEQIMNFDYSGLDYKNKSAIISNLIDRMYDFSKSELERGKWKIQGDSIIRPGGFALAYILSAHTRYYRFNEFEKEAKEQKSRFDYVSIMDKQFEGDLIRTAEFYHRQGKYELEFNEIKGSESKFRRAIKRFFYDVETDELLIRSRKAKELCYLKWIYDDASKEGVKRLLNSVKFY